MNNQYLQELYSKKAISKINVLGCYFRRLLILFRVYRYDLIWVEKELFPYLPSWVEWLLSKTKGYIVDYDDAIFHNYDQSESKLVQLILSKKIDRVMRYSDYVFVGNSYIEKRAELAAAKNISILPTVIDTNKYKRKTSFDEKSIIRVGWIGSPTTTRYLIPYIPILEFLSQNFGIRFVIINGPVEIKFLGDLQIIPWTEETEADSILGLDIGIMPLPDSPWERGKCAYKLIQYMACGLPVVASPVGVNTTVVSHGYNGYLADTLDDWKNYLVDLILNPEKRKSMGNNGYKRVQENYTLDKNIERLTEVLDGYCNRTTSNSILSTNSDSSF